MGKTQRSLAGSPSYSLQSRGFGSERGRMCQVVPVPEMMKQPEEEEEEA